MGDFLGHITSGFYESWFECLLKIGHFLSELAKKQWRMCFCGLSVSHRKFYFYELVVPVFKKCEVSFKAKSELLVPVLRINVISNLGCRSLCMAFLPPFSGVFRLSLSGSWPGIPCRRSFDFQGSMKACRKHITMKQKFLGSITSAFYLQNRK